MATRLWVSYFTHDTHTHTHTHTFNLNCIMDNTITDSNKRAYTNTMFECSISVYYRQLL